MTYLAAVLIVVSFALALQLLGVFATAARALSISRATATLMRDTAVGDADKERATQKASVALLQGFVSIVVRCVGAIGISLVPLLFLDAIGVVNWGEVLRLLATLKGIALASVAMALVFMVRKGK